MDHNRHFDEQLRPLTSQQALSATGIPYPFDQLPELGEPFSDVRLMDTVLPRLERISGLTGVLAALPEEAAITSQQRQDALRLLASCAAAAPVIVRRWWEARESP